MPVLGPRQEAAAGELREWWEDLWQRGIGSQVVLLKVPPGWGRYRVLDRVAEDVNSDGAPVTVVLRIQGRYLPDGTGPQAEQIRRWLSGEQAWRKVAEAFDVDRPGGALQLALDVLGVLIPPAGAPALIASRTVGLLRKLRERSAVGEEREGSTAGVEGAVARAIRALDAEVVARAARAVAEVSRQAPVVVLINDAERLDLGQAVTLLENLMFCRDGQLLAVVAADPGSELAAALRASDRVALAGVVHTVDADPDMSYAARAALAREQCPGLPEPVIRRIAERTRTFHDVFEVTGAERGADRLAEIRPDDDPRDMLTVADAVIDTQLKRGPPSAEAVMVAWAGGVAHPRQVAAALAVAGEKPLDIDPDLAQSGSLVRLADPGSSRFTAPVTALPAPERYAMATAVLEQAAEICEDSESGLVDRIVAGRAAHHVRRELGERPRLSLVRVQRVLIADLEAGGDLAAYEIAEDALAECPHGDPYKQDRQQLEAAVLRLASALPTAEQDPLVAELTGEAIQGGAAMGLEARVWAAVNLLGMPGRSEQALRLIDQITAKLDSRGDLGESEVGWRLLLAFWAGRAGYPSAAQPLLAPLLGSRDDDVQDAAMRVLRAIKDPHADDRLQIEMLEAELQTEPSDDDCLRIHHALADAYGKLGDYRQALDHTQRELPLRNRLQGSSHPDTLTTRANLARWTGRAGDPAGARDQYAALLTDLERVLGAEHPDTLTTRANLARWAGVTGDAAWARDEYAALLPIVEQVLGAEHPLSLGTRDNLAYLTGVTGDADGARKQHAALLPIRERVSGAEHPHTLTTRRSLAFWTRLSGR
jgi:tetratricopeptide (TPR) repeat protein